MSCIDKWVTNIDWQRRGVQAHEESVKQYAAVGLWHGDTKAQVLLADADVACSFTLTSGWKVCRCRFAKR